MSDQTLFTQPDAAVTDNPQPAPATSGYDTMLQGIKSDDGRQKYATVSDALTSIPHKEQHIGTLESENSVLREELAASKARLEAAEALRLQDNTRLEHLRPSLPVQVLMLMTSLAKYGKRCLLKSKRQQPKVN